MSATQTFAEYYRSLNEDSISAGSLGGAEGFNPDGGIQSSDFYASDDSRVPKSIFGGVLTRRGIAGRRKKKKKEEEEECMQVKDPKKPLSEYNQAKLEQGIKVEYEHTNDRALAAKIAAHHLDEDENYYDKLSTIERHG